jgi:hypothetical protein
MTATGTSEGPPRTRGVPTEGGRAARLDGVRQRRAHAPLLLALVVATTACGDDGGSEQAFCATARRFVDDNPASVFDRYDPADPASAAVLLREAGDRMQAWADDAPGEIDGDVQVIADAAEQLAAAFESPSAAAERIDELETSFAAVETASARLTAFTQRRCGVDLDAAANVRIPASTTTTTAPPGG